MLFSSYVFSATALFHLELTMRHTTTLLCLFSLALLALVPAHAEDPKPITHSFLATGV